MKKVSVDAGVLDVKFQSQNMDIVFLLDNEKYLQVLQAEDMYSKRGSIFFDQCHTFFKGKSFNSDHEILAHLIPSVMFVLRK